MRYNVLMVQIKDNGEPLVEVKKYCPDFVIQLDGKRKAYLRRSVVLRLKKARSLLPKGLTFIIRDAWRPAELQEKIRQEFIVMFQKKHPSWSKARAQQEAKKFVAESKGVFASGHMTGGAVDLRLINKKTGKRVPMRSRKLTYQENATPYQIKLPKHIQHNREIMYQALNSAGLTQCYNEFWHWSYGDAHWARRVGEKVAVYAILPAYA
jgi:D-alanyl-D-alanine dipeptidase